MLSVRDTIAKRRRFLYLEAALAIVEEQHKRLAEAEEQEKNWIRKYSEDRLYTYEYRPIPLNTQAGPREALLCADDVAGRSMNFLRSFANRAKTMKLQVSSSFFNLLTAFAIVVSSSVSPVTDTGEEIKIPRLKENQFEDVNLNYTIEPLRKGPWVDTFHSGNVSTVLGRTASLRCRVLDRGNNTVSWIRHRDVHLLTVDQYTYTSDQRFQAMYEPSTGDWVLLVGSVQSRDRGVYECQIGTTPPTSHFVTLHIMKPKTEILGGEDLHINMGSTINLTCLVLYHARSPHTLVWLHRGKEVRYNSVRGGVTVLTEAGEVTRSALLIQRATLSDAGNYTCMPKGGAPATARVHVLHGELQAAVQGSAGVGGRPQTLEFVLIASIWASWAGLPSHLIAWTSTCISVILFVTSS
ncbi:protein sidekick-like [Palaemon carinicauda]|uniref:protein sidekick-like n=1 Tax=Palaemon carinicauda TaxID=392227 RepID=UPI0035B697ED